MLTRDSLDQFSGSGKGARHLSSLVLTSLCSVTGPERRPKETGESLEDPPAQPVLGAQAGPEPPLVPPFPPGLWSLTVSGRKHSLRLCSPRQAEAERWGVALREVIASKVPLETPTQLLLRDIEVSKRTPEMGW